MKFGTGSTPTRLTEGETSRPETSIQIIQQGNVEDYMQQGRVSLYDAEQIFTRPRLISLGIMSQAFSGGHTSTARDSA